MLACKFQSDHTQSKSFDFDRYFSYLHPGLIDETAPSINFLSDCDITRNKKVNASGTED